MKCLRNVFSPAAKLTVLPVFGCLRVSRLTSARRAWRLPSSRSSSRSWWSSSPGRRVCWSVWWEKHGPSAPTFIFINIISSRDFQNTVCFLLKFQLSETKHIHSYNLVLESTFTQVLNCTFKGNCADFKSVLLHMYKIWIIINEMTNSIKSFKWGWIRPKASSTLMHQYQ